MPRRRFTEDEIQRVLKRVLPENEPEPLNGFGEPFLQRTVSETCRAYGISRRTFYRWESARKKSDSDTAIPEEKLKRYTDYIRNAVPFPVKFQIYSGHYPTEGSIWIETEFGRQRFVLKLRRSYMTRSQMGDLARDRTLDADVLLFAKHISRDLGRALSKKRTNFVDEAGNLRLELSIGQKYCYVLLLGRSPRALRRKQPMIAGLT